VQDYYEHPSGHTLSFVPTTFLPISATIVRRTIAARKSVRYLVTDDVAEYIQRHGLYSSL
jgi:nicotinic acid mononucleotide adenylyltransferase